MPDEAKTLVIGQGPPTGDPVFDATMYLVAVSCFGKGIGSIHLESLEKLHDKMMQLYAKSRSLDAPNGNAAGPAIRPPHFDER